MADGGLLKRGLVQDDPRPYRMAAPGGLPEPAPRAAAGAVIAAPATAGIVPTAGTLSTPTTTSPLSASGVTAAPSRPAGEAAAAGVAAASLQAERERAYAEGLKDGQARAQASATRAASEQAAALQKLLRHVDAAVAQHARQLDDLLPELVLAAVCRVLGTAYADASVVAAAVHSTLADAGLDSAATVKVHPDDATRLLAAIEASASWRPGAVVVEASADVELGGCLIESAAGTLDARLEVQLESLRDRLQQARASWSKP